MNQQEEHFVKGLEALVQRLLAEETKIQPSVAIEDIRYVLDRIYRMRQLVEAGSLPPREIRYKSLTRLVMDQWPLGSPLSDRIAELEERFAQL